MRMKMPHEKKHLGYARDERSIYGETDRASSVAGQLKSKRLGRTYRTLTRPEHPENVLRADGAEAAETKVRGVGRKSWTSRPDMPLGKHLARKRMRQARP